MAGTQESRNTLENGLRFRIENDILIGEEKPIYRECTNVGKLVLEKLRSRPQFVGQVEAVSEKETTYGEMAEKSVKCAVWLKNQGVQPGDIIGICTDNHLDSYVPLLGALYIAAIPNPWDNELSQMSAKYFLSLTGPKVVFVNAESARSVAEAAKELNTDVKLVLFGELSGYQTLADILSSVESAVVQSFECAKINRPDEVGTIVCSSGTSGPPKGTEISHSAMINYMSHLAVHDLEGHVSMWIPTMRWYCGLFIILQAILKYSKRVIVPDYDNDDELCQFIEKYKVTWFRSDTCFSTRLVKFDVISKYSLPTLKVLLFGGAHFQRELQETLKKQLPQTHVLQSYGMTDFGGLCAYQTENSTPGSCGFIAETARLKVLDLKTGEILSANRTGEICAKSSYMMSGYFKNPSATANALDSDGWLHTGDLGYYDQNGEVFLVNRISEFINYRSINVCPAEIEALLQDHPSVLQVAVVPVPHDVEGERAMAFVVKVAGKEVAKEELMDLVDKNLPWHSRLYGGIEFLDKMPLTATRKIGRKELKQLAKALGTK